MARYGEGTSALVSYLDSVTIERDSAVPPYRQLAAILRDRIASGELSAGTRLRAERDLATYYAVSYGTVRRAMKELRERGLIATIHGRGTFVNER